MSTGHDDPLEDGALARRIAGGRDVDAEASLCRRMLPRIRAYGLRHLRQPADAADLAQHVMVVVLEALRDGRVEEPDRLAAFVMGTCRNTVLDWRKGTRTRGALLDRFGPTLGESVAPPPAATERARLEQCLQHLAERERLIVALTFVADRDGDEIARELGMSAVHVRVTRHRALRHLEQCLSGARA